MTRFSPRSAAAAVLFTSLLGNPLYADGHASPFHGFYAVASVGSIAGDFGGGYEDSDADFPGDGSGSLSGRFVSLAAGYDFTYQDKFVFGPEVVYRRSDADGSEECPNTAWDCEYEIDQTWALRGRVGYKAMEDLLIFGVASIGISDVSAQTVNANGDKFKDEKQATTFGLGIGADYDITETIAVRGLMMFEQFSDETFEVDGGTRVETDAATASLEIGVVYKF